MPLVKKSEMARKKRGAGEMLRRYALLIVSLFVLAFGVALSTKANLGVSPISCLPYVISVCPGVTWTMGTITVAMHIVFILAQIALLRRNFRCVQLLQLGIAFVFGFFTDFTLFLVSFIPEGNYAFSVALCLASFFFVALGVFLEVKADVVMLAGEGIMLAISRVFKIEFGKVKVGFDCSLVIAGTAVSLIFMRELVGIREGTIAAAVVIGLLVRRMSRFVDLHFGKKSSGNVPVAPYYSPNCPLVITIAREYGSGGHALGEEVARRLGLSFFDGALIRLTAAKVGFTRDYIRKNEQQIVNRFLYELYAQNYAYAPTELPPRDALFLAQTKIIRDIAATRGGVIVGRCSNFILKGRPHTLNVFLHADINDRRERVIKNYGVAPEDADAEIARMDGERRNHCRYYTGEDWGLAKNYDLSLDTSLMGLSVAVDAIVDAALHVVKNQKSQSK